MHDSEPDIQPQGDAGDDSERTPLRRRENRAVEFDRRRGGGSESFDIGAALELHLDQCKTRRSMIKLLEEWLAESRNRDPDTQNPEYAAAVERAIEVMKNAPDIETAVIMLQRRY